MLKLHAKLLLININTSVKGLRGCLHAILLSAMQDHRHRGQMGSSSSLSQAEDVILPMPGLQLLRRSTPTVHHASQHPPGNRRRSRPANTPSLWTTHGHPLSRVYSASV